MSAGTVTVACKLEGGLILEADLQALPANDKRGATRLAIQIRGPASRNQPPPTYPLVGGFGITPGVPRSIFESWCERERVNGFASALASGLIFADEDISRVMERARDHAAKGKEAQR